MQLRPTPPEAYQEYFAPAIFEPLADVLFGCASPQAGERILDVACGTGVVARRAAASTGPSGQVMGVDINPGMIEVARSLSTAGGAPIEYRQGDAQALELPDGSYDLVYCQQGLQFLPDRLAGLREQRRVLAGGGQVALAVWQGVEQHPLFAGFADAELPYLTTVGLDVTRDHLVAPFLLGDRGELASLLSGAGFREVEIVARTIEARFARPDRFVESLKYAYAAVMPRFAEDPAAFAEYLAHTNQDTKALVDRYRDGERVVVPMHTHIATARA